MDERPKLKKEKLLHFRMKTNMYELRSRRFSFVLTLTTKPRMGRIIQADRLVYKILRIIRI